MSENEINVRDMRSTQAPPASAAPPHDEEAETSVLGAIMLAERWIDTISVDVHLQPDDFYRPRHRLIFAAMLQLQSASEPIDTLTVAARLTETGQLEEAGGRDYIETLVEGIPAIGNTKQYGQIVKENSLLRGLLRASQMIQESIATREGDPKELLELAQQRVFEVAQDSQSGELVQLSEILHEELEKLEKQALEGNALTGTPTGFRDLDELTGGLQPGNLIIVAARPSMGKSTLAMNIAENAAMRGFPVAIFSLEMSKSELAQRFLSSIAKIDGDAMRKGKLPKNKWPDVMRAADELSKTPLWIDDSSDINILELRAKARRLHGKAMGTNPDGKGLGLVIVDYLQLLRANDGRDSRVEQVAQMSRGLKILARELNVPVIAVSQLSRAVESRTPPRPQLSDLRESGQIEQDADVVSFIYREEYYLREESERPGIADVIVAKHRNGPVADVELTFMNRFPKFSNLPRGGQHAQQPDRYQPGPAEDPGPEEEYDF